MLNRHFFMTFGCALVLLSCQEKKEHISGQNSEIPKSFIFNMTQMYNSTEDNISFPLWFNDSIIRAKGIKCIKRKLYNSSNNEEDSPGLKEIKIYSFSSEGYVTSINVARYYERYCIDSLLYSYKGTPDSYGYSTLNVINFFGREMKASTEHAIRHKKEEYNAKFLIYSDEKTGGRLFFLTKKKNWGVLSVDSILNPNPNDLIVFGTPKKPVKSYQVENTVTESKVISYTYLEEGIHPKKINSSLDPFINIKYLEYNEQGICTGFIDSTFNNDVFITGKVSTFVFKDNLPFQTIHKINFCNKENEFLQIEKFEYDFFEKEN